MVDEEPSSSNTMGVEDASDRLFRNKQILAPMVRAGTLPFRVLALRYGADTVFTEEVIDRRVVNAVRTENSVLGTVDYVETRGKKSTAIPFQTCALERDHVVYQLGTGDAANALRAAQHVERDVAAVDVNMGCPKRFSLQGGMGAALLKRPDVAADIVGTLRRNLSVPVSVKIRLLDTESDTVEFARRMEKAGACALTVHVRRLEDKPSSKARWEELRPVVDAVSIPVVANGDVYTRADMADIRTLSGCSSVMLARPALLNCSVFRPNGETLPLKQVIQQYLRECIRYDSIYQSAKYTVMEMLTKRRHPDHLKASITLGLPPGAPGMREVTPVKTLEQLATLWDVGADFDAEISSRRRRAEQLGHTSDAESAERSSIHKFDDAYFLGPREDEGNNGLGSATSASKKCPGGGGGGEGCGGVTAAVPAAADSTLIEKGNGASIPEISATSVGGERGCCNEKDETGDRLSVKEAILEGHRGKEVRRGREAVRANVHCVLLGGREGGVEGHGDGAVQGVAVEEKRPESDCVGRGGLQDAQVVITRGQILSDWTCSKRPRKEDENGV